MPKRKPASRRRKPRPAQTLPAKPHKTPFARELATKRRGEISELAFALAAARSGFGIAKPFGDSERYDIILDCRNNDCCDLDCRDLDSRDNDPSHLNPSRHPPVRPRLVRVQVKSSTQLLNGLYHVNAGRRINGRAVPYKLSEIDFIAAYIIPEDSWFILPLPHILGQTSLLFRPKLSPLPGLYDAYRNAWHLLREPDGLEFA
jgi:PD-(D/E)XK endonuclease